MKIYTKTGDQGETGILGGVRVAKDDTLICSVGEVDEVNSHIGLVRSLISAGEVSDLLQQIQADLFVIGGQIANSQSGKPDKVSIDPGKVDVLEKLIDKFQAELPALNAFILPGGKQAGANLHVARCVCRRAERSVVRLSKQGNPTSKSDLGGVVIYLNRMSDLLFVLARYVNMQEGIAEVSWLPIHD